MGVQHTFWKSGRANDILGLWALRWLGSFSVITVGREQRVSSRLSGTKRKGGFDTKHDWQFVFQCKAVAAMQDESRF